MEGHSDTNSFFYVINIYRESFFFFFFFFFFFQFLSLGIHIDILILTGIQNEGISSYKNGHIFAANALFEA